MAEDGWQKIGEVSVDSGQLMIVDPCYTKELPVDISTRYDYHHAVQFPIEKATGVIFSSGYGDGRYEVYALIKGDKYSKDNTDKYKYVHEVKIVLISKEE